MTITEKNLAEKLESISASMLGLDKKEAWTRVAREAAELMGYEFTPEKPEPGTIGITCDGLAAYVDGGGVWRVILANGDWRNANDADAITPARVVPEGELIDLGDVRKGDRVRVELNNGDESTFTVKRVGQGLPISEHTIFYTHTIRTVHLLHREEA